MQLDFNIVEFHAILKNVLFPVDQAKIISDLAANGFQPTAPGQMIENKLIIQQGDLAIKNNTVFTMNSQAQMIRVTGLNILEVYQTWKEIEKILQIQDIDLKSTGRLFEFKIECFIKTGKNPLKIFQNHFKSTNIPQKFDKLFNEKPSSMLGIRLVPSDGCIDTENYYDIRLEPFLRNAKDQYFLNFLYRNKDASKSEKLFANVESKISEILKLIENN
jgi:hypothetical protein